MGLLLDILDQTTITVNEIRDSEQRLKEYIQALLETKLSPQALQAAYQIEQQQAAQDMAAQVQTSISTVSGQVSTQTTMPSLPALFTSGLCHGHVFRCTPDQYFVSHGFDPNTLTDWREAIVEAIGQMNITTTPLKPYFSGDTILGGFRLCGICEKLYSARFSLFLLPALENLNVYLELGIAIGLGAPFFLIQEREAHIPPILAGLGLYTHKGSFMTMRRELGGQVKEYNFGAVHFIKEKRNTTPQPHYLIVAGDQPDDEDFEWSINESIDKAYPQRLTAIPFASLGKLVGNTGMSLENIVAAIQATRFAIYRVDTYSSPRAFLALGMSIGLNRPFLMLCKEGKEVPLDIQGMSTAPFSNFFTLKKELATTHDAFFSQYV